MAFRDERGDLAIEALDATLGAGAGHVAVFVHGLMGSERAWRFGVRPPDTDDAEPPRVDFGHALAQARDQTALYLRYNTGRHISENGRELADMLERALTLPGGPRELTIVAHSMGGLVTRSACHYALEAGHAWIARLRRVFLLGVPSRGARLEQLAHLTTATLTAIWNPWTKLIGLAINQRSAGIKDLRHGFVLDEDWQDFDPDRLAWPVPTRPREPADVRWFVALGTLGDPDSAVAQTLGDGLVHPGSAQGVSLDPRARELLPPAEVQRFPSTGHLALMNDPAVLAQLLEWWEA